MSLRVLIVDDEAMARRRLARLVAARPGAEVVGHCEDGAEVGARVGLGDVDLILLDVDMPQLSGLEAKGLLGPDAPLVVFVTAHAEHALAAFDLGALDYVLKPVAPERLGQALDRAEARVAARVAARAAAADAKGSTLERLAVPTRRGVELLRPEQIRYALVDGASVLIHAERGTYVSDFRMVELEERLGAAFVRTHRRALVNLAHIERLEPVSAGVYVAELSDGATVPVSRNAAKRLKALWRV